MKYLFLLAIIALGSATSLYGAQKEIRVNNDRIVVRSPGKIVVISRLEDNEKGGIMVLVKEHDRFIKKVIIDKDCNIVKEVSFSVQDELPEKFSEEENQDVTKSSEEQTSRTRRCGGAQDDKTQMEYLVEIFRKYEGVVQEGNFKNILSDLKVAVDNKDCHPVVLKVLKGLDEQTTTTHTPSFHFWRMHWNTKEPIRSMWGRKDMNQDRTEDQQKKTELNTEHENQFNQEYVNRQNEWVQHHVKDHQGELEDILRTSGDSSSYIKHTDCSKDAMSKQLVFQNNIREIQGQIYHHQLRAQQLQLQQQFLNQQKHKTKLQITMGQQQGMSFTQLQDLNKVREQLHKKEMDLLESQKNIHLTIHQLHKELTKQEERLQECLEDERTEDERTMVKTF